MLRNLNQSSGGRRILGTPHVGTLAAQISAETAGGDDGPGILYKTSLDPKYAGKYLRARMLDFPEVGSLFVFENGSFIANGLPDGSYYFRYEEYSDDVMQGISTFEIIVGDTDAVAPGAFISGTAVLIPGAATASQSGVVDAFAPGADVSASSTLIPGAATAGQSGVVDAVAPGATLSCGTNAGDQDVAVNLGSIGIKSNGEVIFLLGKF